MTVSSTAPKTTAETCEPIDKAARDRKRFITVWTLVGSVLLVAVVIFLMHILAVPISILIWTAVFVFCLRGVVNGLEKRGINRTLGTTIAYVLLIVAIAVVGLLMFSPAFGLNNQLNSLIASIPHYVDEILAWASEMRERYATLLGDETLQNLLNKVQDSLGSAASALAQGSAEGIMSAGTAVVNTFTAVGFAAVIAFWVLIQLPDMGREVTRIAGPRHAEQLDFFHITFTRIMGGYIKGTLLQCFIIGTASGILFAVLGLPNAAALGIITGVLNIIPIIGPWLGGAVAAIMAVFTSPIAAIIALAGVIVIQQVVYTFVSPKIMANSVDIHPTLTLFALVCGSALGGAMSGLLGSLVGMLVSIPAVAVMKACFVYYFERSTGRTVVANDGVFFRGNPSADGVPNPLKDATTSYVPEAAVFDKAHEEVHQLVKDELSKRKSESLLREDAERLGHTLRRFRDEAHHAGSSAAKGDSSPDDAIEKGDTDENGSSQSS